MSSSFQGPLAVQPESPPEKAAPIRARYIADRILLLLLYKASESDAKGPLLSRQGNTVTLRVGWLARQLKMKSSALYDQLRFLQEAGYVKLDYSAPYGYVRLTYAAPLQS